MAPRRDEDHPDDDAPYRCPACGDGSVVASECTRCELPMYRRSDVLELPTPHRTVPTKGAAGRALVGLTGAVTLGLLFVGFVLALLREETSWMSGYAFALTVVFGIIFSAVVASGQDLGAVALVKLRDRIRAGIRARRSARVREAELSALPNRTEEPVRVRGRVVLDRESEGPSLHVTDGDARVRVEVGPELKVYDRDGETHVLADGAEVELVGVGDRPLGSGDAYRDARGDFVFRRSRIRVLS